VREWSQGTVTANGIAIHYHRTGGPHPPLVLAHGFSDNGLCWTRIARDLEDAFDVVMVDARNHGESARAAVGPDDLADDLAGVIAALGLGRPALMGHSMGAQTAAEVAARYPDRVARLVLEDPPWRTTQSGDAAMARQRDGFRQWLAAMAGMNVDEIAQAGAEASPAWDAEEFPAWARAKQQVDLRALDSMAFTPWRSIVAAIACPTLLLYGDPALGGIVDAEVARAAAAANRFIRTQHVAGAGHNIRREQYEMFLAAVRAFLQADIV
jgi:pimeloyl-ACP methyl ester carboxylesterase